jgi:hypothetical protein
MAPKKKKSTSQQQRKRQQKQQRRSVRKQRRGTSRTDMPTHSFTPPNITGMPELEPFFGNSADADNMIALIKVAVDSMELLEEPEFDQVFIEPIEAVTRLLSIAEAMGFDPDTFGDIMEHGEDETNEEVFNELCRQLLTPELHRKLIEGLSNLRRRLPMPAAVEKRRRAAAVQFFLETEEMSMVVPLLGLVRALILNAIEAGFALAEATFQVEKLEEQERTLSLEAFQERLLESEWVANFEQMLEQSPALRRYMENQVDQMYEEGLKATFTGELTLNLYTPDEIAPVLQVVRTASAEQDESIKEVITTLFPQLAEMVVQLFTPERLAQLRRQLAALIADPAYATSKWAPFLHIKLEDFAEDDTIDGDQRFLVAAFMGQLLPILNAEQEDDE